MFGYRGNYLGVIEQQKDGQQHLRYFTRGGCLGDMLLRGFLLSISALSTSLCDDQVLLSCWCVAFELGEA